MRVYERWRSVLSHGCREFELSAATEFPVVPLFLLQRGLWVALCSPRLDLRW